MDKIIHKLRSEAAARYVGLAPSTLAKMRVRGDRTPYSKAGARVVVYDIRDLEAWLRSTRRTLTRAVHTRSQV